MKKSAQQSIMIIVILVLGNSGIYFVTAYSQMQESSDLPSQIQTMLFATAAIVYLPLGIWMIKNNLHSRDSICYSKFGLNSLDWIVYCIPNCKLTNSRNTE